MKLWSMDLAQNKRINILRKKKKFLQDYVQDIVITNLGWDLTLWSVVKSQKWIIIQLGCFYACCVWAPILYGT